MSNSLYVICDCSAKIQVTSAKCGSALRCRCGKMVPVPTLRELRANTGLGPVQSDPLQRIEYLRACGRLPPEPFCVYCGTLTDGAVECLVRYESKAFRFLDFIPKPLALLVAGFWFVPAMRRVTGFLGSAAEDRYVNIWVRLCDRCHYELADTRRKMKALAAESELYAELFRIYPHAAIETMRHHPASNPRKRRGGGIPEQRLPQQSVQEATPRVPKPMNADDVFQVVNGQVAGRWRILKRTIGLDPTDINPVLVSARCSEIRNGKLEESAVDVWVVHRASLGEGDKGGYAIFFDEEEQIFGLAYIETSDDPHPSIIGYYGDFWSTLDAK